MRVLITGAAGNIGRLVVPRMRTADRVLRLLDSEPIGPIEPSYAGQSPSGVEVVRASINDADAMRAACEDVDAVVHLAGIPSEAPWEQILRTNIDGTHTVLEAARAAGVPRVVLASSNHAVGFHPGDGQVAPDYLFPRPDTYYGVSKAAMEALGSLYHDRYGMDVVCLRIGACLERPRDERMLAIWLSPDDVTRLLEASICAPRPGFRVVWGMSKNTRGWFSMEEGRAIGYQPQDDAEQYAADVDPSNPADLEHLGGSFCSVELDEPGLNRR